jgi:hypothetical protein
LPKRNGTVFRIWNSVERTLLDLSASMSMQMLCSAFNYHHISYPMDCTIQGCTI